MNQAQENAFLVAKQQIVGCWQFQSQKTIIQEYILAVVKAIYDRVDILSSHSSTAINEPLTVVVGHKKKIYDSKQKDVFIGDILNPCLSFLNMKADMFKTSIEDFPYTLWIKSSGRVERLKDEEN